MNFNKTSNSSINDFTTAYINYNSVISLIRITLVLLSRGGFILIQSGSVPTETSYDVLLQNIVEFAVTTSSYGLVGVLLSFGNESYKGLIGYGTWDYTQTTCDNIVFGFGVVIIGSAIITTFLIGRLHFFGYVIIAFIYAGFSQPIIMHWIWHHKGWMNNMELFNVSVKFYDHAGALIVHATSGLIGLIGMTFLGRRIIRLNDIDEASLGSESPNTTLLGYLLLANGLIGLSLPYKQPDLFYASVILINSILGLSGGLTAAIILEFILWRDIFNYWALLRLIQGGIAGLVLISSFINYCYPPASFAVTFVGGTLAICISKLIYKSALEDYCNIISIHLFCGLWSSFLHPFVARIRTMKLIELLWQVTCATIITSCFYGLYFVLFLILYWAGFLRSHNEENCHKRSKNITKGAHICPFRRIFTLQGVDVLEPGSSGKAPNNLVCDLESNMSSPELIPRRDSEMNKSSSSKSSKSEKKNVKSNIVDNYKNLEKKLKMCPKSKNIYTIHNCRPHNKNLPVVTQERQFCSGDPADDMSVHKLEDLIANQCEIRNKIGEKEILNIKQKTFKTKSHIRLSKSKRYIDFSKHKKLKSKGKNRNNALVNIYINRSSELIAYDKKYNDGITTYKIPRLLEYISD